MSNIKLMDENNNLISDPKNIANIFNDHFSTVGAKVQQKIPIDKNGNFKDFLSKRDQNKNKWFLPTSF